MKNIQVFAGAALALAFPALAADAPATVAIIQKNLSFSQPSIKIYVGDQVMWGNDDDVNHNVTVVNGANETDHGDQKPHQIIKQTFDAAGTYKVICKIHPRMKMTVVVQ